MYLINLKAGGSLALLYLVIWYLDFILLKWMPLDTAFSYWIRFVIRWFLVANAKQGKKLGWSFTRLFVYRIGLYEFPQKGVCTRGFIMSCVPLRLFSMRLHRLAQRSIYVYYVCCAHHHHRRFLLVLVHIVSYLNCSSMLNFSKQVHQNHSWLRVNSIRRKSILGCIRIFGESWLIWLTHWDFVFRSHWNACV